MQRILLPGRIVVLFILCLTLLGGLPAHAQSTTIIEVASNSSEPEANHWITLTAFLTCVDALPTGTVTFQIDQVDVAQANIVDGVATVGLTFNHGDHEITAIYGGDSACGAGRETVHQIVISPVILTLTSSVNPSALGQAVTFTASLFCSSGAAGSVQFKDGSTTFATVPITITTPPDSGTASVTTSSLSSGTHDIVAVDTGCGSIADELTQYVGAAGVTWCNLGGDGRLNSACGDRIVVYCNSKANPANIDLWVIDPTSNGHELTEIPLTALMAVLMGKYIKALGTDGVIFAGLDASGNGYAALQGGPYGGTAKGDWLKTFQCTVSQTTF